MKTWTASVPVVRVETLLPAPAPGAGPAAGIIDLRSPAEYAEDHVPGAHNVPLFDDEGRAIVGLFYKQFSPAAAFQEARALVLKRIRALVQQVAALGGWEMPAQDLERALLEVTSGGLERLEEQLRPVRLDALPAAGVVLSCWRGGLRSRSVVAFLRALGFEAAVGLEGGYKAYRRHCLGYIDAWSAPPAFALRGLTGVGKTLVLRALERRRPELVLDLEHLAGHRSSLLGMVGLEPCTQKTFDTRMFERLRAGFPRAVVLEGESRRVGEAILPSSVWEVLQGAENLRLVAPRERRVQVLLDDYLADPAARDDLRRQLAQVEERIERKLDLVARFDAGREPAVVELLLEHYYDPLYRHSERGKDYALQIDASDPESAAARVEAWVEARLETQVDARPQ